MSPRSRNYTTFYCPHLTSHKEGELPNYTNVALPSGDSLTYFDEGFSRENLKSDEENTKQIKSTEILILDYFQVINKSVTFIIKVFILKNMLK